MQLEKTDRNKLKKKNELFYKELNDSETLFLIQENTDGGNNFVFVPKSNDQYEFIFSSLKPEYKQHLEIIARRYGLEIDWGLEKARTFTTKLKQE